MGKKYSKINALPRLNLLPSSKTTRTVNQHLMYTSTAFSLKKRIFTDELSFNKHTKNRYYTRVRQKIAE